MKAFEVMGTINEVGELRLDNVIDIGKPIRVKVIVLVSEQEEIDPDDTPIEEVKASLKRALQEVKEGKTIPLEQMWEGIDTNE